MTTQEFDKDAVCIKVVLVGESGVGKTSLLLSFTTNTFDVNQSETIGVELHVKSVDVLDSASGERRRVKMNLWDTAGQELYRSLTRSYYRGAHAVVFVYDVNNPRTFSQLGRWIEEAKAQCAPDEAEAEMVGLVIGNKTDLCSAETMKVSYAEAQAFARQHRMLFALTSAKTQQGVAEAFDELARVVYDTLREKYPQGLPQVTRKRNVLSGTYATLAAGSQRAYQRCCK